MSSSNMSSISVQGAPSCPISVILTVYNGSQWLPSAVDSILTQTLDTFELVAIDDGSTDTSLHILRRYAAADPRVRIIAQLNQGQALARNAGMREARGSYIAFMDADDESLPERLQVQKAFLDHHAGVACIGSGIEVIKEDGRRIGTITAPVGQDRCRKRLLSGRYYSMGASLMIRRDLLQGIGGFRELFRQRNDSDFLLRIAEKYPIDNVRDTLYRYRVNTASQSLSRLDEALWENKIVWELHQERLGCGEDRLQRGERIKSPFTEGYKGATASVRDTLAYLHVQEVEIAMEEGRWPAMLQNAYRAVVSASGKRRIFRSLLGTLREGASS